MPLTLEDEKRLAAIRIEVRNLEKEIKRKRTDMNVGLLNSLNEERRRILRGIKGGSNGMHELQ